MDKVVVYSNGDRGTSTVILVSEKFEDWLNEFGPDVENWPDDLDSYRRDTGFYIWEGEMEEDENLSGSTRKLSDPEVRLLSAGKLEL